MRDVCARYSEPRQSVVIPFPWRRPPLIECPDCGRLMSDVQRGGVVLERFCSSCKVTYTNGPSDVST